MKKSYRKYLVEILIYITIIIFIIIIQSNPILADNYVKTFCSFYYNFIGIISNNIPFALFEFVLLSFALTFTFHFIKFIKSIIHKKEIAEKTYKLITFFVKIILSYSLIAGISYHRSEIQLPLYNDIVDDNLINSSINYYLQDYNNLANTFEVDDNLVTICPYSFNELSSIMQKEAKKLDNYNYYLKYNAKPKATFLSHILSELNITGIDFAFTSEANINSVMPSIDIPFTMAHEIAHLKGVMRENDANLVALYICLTSEIDYVRYSGYFRGFSSLLDIKRNTNYNEYQAILKEFNKQIFIDNNNYYNYFKKHNLLEKISDFINDLYLKFNSQKDGTGSYDDKDEKEDTGNKDNQGNTIYQYVNYSPYQKLMFQLYLNTLN